MLPAGSVVTQAGRSLSNAATVTVQGPAALSVADAEVEEGADAAVTFEVTLSRAASSAVTVDYATADGTAVAGEDYTATSGTLTFAAGETAKTVSVPVLDDALDEGRETFSLKLSNATGAVIADGEAEGAIVNTDAMRVRGWRRSGAGRRATWPKRWRRGCAAAAVRGWCWADARCCSAMRPATRSVVNPSRGKVPPRGCLRAAPGGFLPRGARGVKDTGAILPPGSVAERAAPREFVPHGFGGRRGGGAPAGRCGAGGRPVASRARRGDLALDGDVTTATVGFDFGAGALARGRGALAKLGRGAFRTGGTCETGCAGEVESALTGLYPYARYAVSARLRCGASRATVRGADAPPRGGGGDRYGRRDAHGAAGARGVVLPAAGPGGLELALRTDLLAVETSSEAAGTSRRPRPGRTASGCCSRVRAASPWGKASSRPRRRWASATTGATGDGRGPRTRRFSSLRLGQARGGVGRAGPHGACGGRL